MIEHRLWRSFIIDLSAIECVHISKNPIGFFGHGSTGIVSAFREFLEIDPSFAVGHHVHDIGKPFFEHSELGGIVAFPTTDFLRIVASKEARSKGSAPDAASAPKRLAEMTLPLASASR